MSFDKAQLDAWVDGAMPELWKIAQYVHANPEVAFTEEKAYAVQREFLVEQGFVFDGGVAGLPTAFTATYGGGAPHLGIISEYDALPGLGHACGHNLICSTALGTALCVKSYLEATGAPGTVTVFGTPAEEEGGGKISMLEHGAFDGVDALFFMHPTSDLTKLAGYCMSSMRLGIVFKGVSAHAGSHPWDGANALSAANLYFGATGLMRQHFHGDVHLSGIVVEGGRETGMIPDRAEVRGSLSAFSMANLNAALAKVENCARGAALAMGCDVEFSAVPGYQGRVPNGVLSDICRRELEDLGEPMFDGLVDDFGGEDLGNVSRLIPVCNPYVTIFPDYKISGHTNQFRELSDSPAGERCIRVACKALARSMVDVYENPAALQEAKHELEERMKRE